MPRTNALTSSSSLASQMDTPQPPDPVHTSPATPPPRPDIVPSNSRDGFPQLPLPVLQKRPASTRRRNTIRLNGVALQWMRFKSLVRRKFVTCPVVDSLDLGLSTTAHEDEPSSGSEFIIKDEDGDEVDEVVVDRSWFEEPKSSAHSDADEVGSHRSHASVDELPFQPTRSGFWTRNSTLIFLRWRLWPNLMEFFSSRFADPQLEEAYQREEWAQTKGLSLWSSLFFIINWLLGVVFIQTPVVLADKIFYYGFAPAFTVPLILVCAFDVPRRFRNLYQIYLGISVWSWSFYQIIFVALCGYYDSQESQFTCGSKDFLITFYYTSALQTIALFGASFYRFPAMIGSIIFLIMSGCLIVPVRASWTRNIMDFVIYQGVLLYTHYQRENSARRLYTLRMQLKLQFQRTQRAQVNERKAADSKRRLTSYVFHEVRVPLNTALLAVQNLDASGTIAREQQLEFHALEGSLSMMSKVLNDVLDFNRMDSGRLESLSKPYAFHQVMRSMFIPLQLATDARNLKLVIDLDTTIDDYARRAECATRGETPEAIALRLENEPSGEKVYGMVVGDETRLRQIVTNLASNACKFTPPGGTLTIVTRLVLPATDDINGRQSSKALYEGSPSAMSESALTASKLDQLNRNHHHPNAKTLKDRIVVRIEVTDTGWGIRPKDMAESKLFSAFNQTEQGRQQGGKGTGLGLALVRQIVKLSGGRLGIQSKIGVGSTFWVELPLGVGGKIISTPSPSPPDLRLHPTESAPQSTQLSNPPGLDSGLAPPLRIIPLKRPSKSSNADGRPVVSSYRSNSALHGLMNQAGLVELVLSKHVNDGHSQIPTRAIGDVSTGTDYPLPREPLPIAPIPFKNPIHDDIETDDEKENHVFDTTGIGSLHPRLGSLRLHIDSARDNLDSDGVSPPKKVEPETPSTPSSPPPLHPISFPSSPASSSKLDREVLVVDDDYLTRTLMTRLLSRLGCTVHTAENGQMALDILVPSSTSISSTASTSAASTSSGHGRQFLVVFMDNQMPVMSGLEAVSKLRQLGRHDFIVGVTGNALLTDQKEYLDAGVDHVLIKPVLERSLKNMLIKAEEGRKVDTERANL
ncbi:hypothetical protein BDN72DRAFT_837652 [Pluteus cervinus]|uniref:Uncharacterized protein n=1 Tax=Pluteus cervinus TaxID=181527 RepID=A0ACD3B0M3_9AGAR|nr:hypothetical protein BDN72DRAFT_837652 [Pluteus cervinus]